MDPLTLFVESLIAGAAAAGKGIASQAVKECYTTLKTKITDYFKANNHPEVDIALGQIEADAEVNADTWRKPLEAVFKKTEIQTDPEIKDLFDRLIQALKDAPETSEVFGKFAIKMNNCKVGNIGENIFIENQTL